AARVLVSEPEPAHSAPLFPVQRLAHGTAGNDSGSGRRPLRRRGRRGHAAPGATPGRGQARHGAARVSRRSSSWPRRSVHHRPMIAPARVAAYQILRSVSAGTADLPAAIHSTRDRLPDERDQALAAEIATGVQRWRAALDHLIVEFSRRPIDRLDPEVVDILRLSAYQLTHLTRVPASASVDDAVELTKRAGKRSAAGFVNAVLRAISRMRNHLPLPPRPDRGTDRSAALAYLSVTLSHPLWLVARWLDRLGFDRTEAWCRFNNHPAPLTLRANRLMLDPMELTRRLAAEGVEVRPGRFAPDALLVESGHPLRGSREGDCWFIVQDEASQLVPLMAAAPGLRVLDAC